MFKKYILCFFKKNKKHMSTKLKKKNHQIQFVYIYIYIYCSSVFIAQLTPKPFEEISTVHFNLRAGRDNQLHQKSWSAVATNIQYKIK
jgi:hypothetical protein